MPAYRVRALADAAAAAGVELCLGSAALAATPDGTVTFADGSQRSADLVVAADGVNSSLRDALGLTRTRTLLADGAQRLTIARLPPTAELASADTVVEWWSGTRRVIYGACSPDEIYVALSCRAAHARARKVPKAGLFQTRLADAVTGDISSRRSRSSSPKRSHSKSDNSRSNSHRHRQRRRSCDYGIGEP